MNEEQADEIINLLENISRKLDELVSSTNYISDNKSWNLYDVKSALEDIQRAVENIES